jgi:hypothetical protein
VTVEESLRRSAAVVEMVVLVATAALLSLLIDLLNLAIFNTTTGLLFSELLGLDIYLLQSIVWCPVPGENRAMVSKLITSSRVAYWCIILGAI